MSLTTIVKSRYFTTTLAIIAGGLIGFGVCKQISKNKQTEEVNDISTNEEKSFSDFSEFNDSLKASEFRCCTREAEKDAWVDNCYWLLQEFAQYVSDTEWYISSWIKGEKYNSNNESDYAKFLLKNADDIKEAYLDDRRHNRYAYLNKEVPSIQKIFDDWMKDQHVEPPKKVEPIPFDDDDHPLDDDEDDIHLVKVMDDAAVKNIIAENGYDKESNKKPKLIKQEDYGEIFNYTADTLYFYRDDGILTTDDDEIIEDPEEILDDALDKYGFRDNNESAIYVRNYKLETDFEILKMNDSYQKAVLGG